MQLRTGLDLLHRRIEEWTELVVREEPGLENALEGFREYGTDLVAFLHDMVEQLGIAQNEIFVADKDVTSLELVEEVMEAFIEEWEQLGFGEQPAELDLDALRPVMEAIAAVLEAPLDDAEEPLDEATTYLEEFVAQAL